MGAVHLLVPGPKMIYHFGDLGYESSIFACTDGTVNNQNDAITGDCKLATKLQPQWTGNWLASTARRKIYDDWAKMIELKRTQNVFKNGQHTWVSTTGKTRLNVFTNAAQTTELSYVIVMTNVTNATTNDAGNFPYPGTWYNLMTGEELIVTNTSTPISIEADGFKVYGNKQAVLSTGDFNLAKIALYPNPSRGIFNISTDTKQVSIYSITGQLVKEFKGDFDSNYQYEIDNLNQGMYIVKVIDQQDREVTLKLMKQ